MLIRLNRHLFVWELRKIPYYIKNQKLYPINLLDTPKTVLITISLLNSSVMCSFPSDDYFSILLGIDYENVLDLHYDQKSIDLRQALIAIGNDIRFLLWNICYKKTS